MVATLFPVFPIMRILQSAENNKGNTYQAPPEEHGMIFPREIAEGHSNEADR